MQSADAHRISPHELFRTSKGVIYQHDITSSFTMEFLGKTAVFKVQEFLHFKKSIDKINLTDLLLGDCPDLQIIHHKFSNHLFVVTLCDLVAMKELLAGAKVMLELNSILNNRLVTT